MILLNSNYWHPVSIRFATPRRRAMIALRYDDIIKDLMDEISAYVFLMAISKENAITITTPTWSLKCACR